MNKISTDNKLIRSFIETFLSTSVKRKTNNNQIEKIVDVMNKVSKKHFSGKIDFEIDTVLDSFVDSGFTVVKSDFYTTTVGGTGRANNEHVNIKAQEMRDLKMTLYDTFPEKYSEETIQRLNQLKTKLKVFWDKNDPT